MGQPNAAPSRLHFRPFLIGSLATLFLLSIPSGFIDSAQDYSDLQTKIVLTSQYNGYTTDPEFSCQGKIHGYLSFSRPIVGDHLLEGIWRLPSGVVGEHAKAPISFAPPGRRTAYVWMEFEEEKGGFLSFRDSTPSENGMYNGPWTLEVRLDGQPILDSTFEVRCDS